MTENMKKYLEMISQDEEFRKEMDKLEEEHVQAQKEKIMEHAASKGITLTEADFAESAELSDDELDAVAGGATCGCVVGGGGTATRPKEETVHAPFTARATMRSGRLDYAASACLAAAVRQSANQIFCIKKRLHA